MSIYIARHGETNDNARRVLQQPDSPLSILGRTQARLLGTRLANEKISHVLCSDYTRARETAECVLTAFDATLVFQPLLRERNFGELRGLPYSELPEHPFSPNLVPPAGESWSEFHQRVTMAWKFVTEFSSTTPLNLLVITHGLVCQSLFDHHLAPPKKNQPQAGVLNTALTRVANQAPWTVELLNCTQHLTQDEITNANMLV